MGNSIYIQSLKHRYKKSEEVLDIEELYIKQGEFVAIIGPSGIGKSTLLRLIGGFEKPTAGNIMQNGRKIRKPKKEAVMLFQNDALLPWRTAAENISLALENLKYTKTERHKRIADLLHLVHLEGYAGHYPRELSGGMRKRIAFARALANDPEVLLLDEPFGALDYLCKKELQMELKRIWKKKAPTVVLVTHDLEEAANLAQRILVLSGRPAKIQQSSLEYGGPTSEKILEETDRSGPGLLCAVGSLLLRCVS